MDNIVKLFGLIFIIYYIYNYCNNKNIEHMDDTISNNKLTSDEKKALIKFKKISIKQKIYSKILKKTQEALNELDIPFFLSSGTCLGYFRENKFLDHDYDIDIGIFEDDYTPNIINKMEEKGLILYRTLGNLETGLELSFRLSGTELGNKAKIDIFVHYLEDDNIYWSSYMAPKFEKQVKYMVSNFDLQSVKFMDCEVNVPYPTVKYLREHYGKEWYIPVKSKGEGGTYDYRSSPMSIV